LIVLLDSKGVHTLVPTEVFETAEKYAKAALEDPDSDDEEM